MPLAVLRRAALAALLLATPACTRDVPLLSFSDGGSPADRTPETDQRPAGGSMGSGGDAGGGTGGAGGISSLCSGGVVRFEGANGTCSGTLAARSHRFALCSCSDWTVSAPFYTDAMSSNSLPPGPAPAAVGVNGKISATGALSIRGSLYASGVGGISETAALNVFKTLHSAGPVVLAQPATGTVTSDAYIGGDVMGALRINGTLHLAPTAAMGLATTAVTTTRETVTVPDPCDCSMPFDVGGLIVKLSAKNDNAANDWDSNRLVMPSGVVNLDVPCGSFFLTAINSQSMVNLAVHGRALIAVGGDVSLGGGMTVIMDPGAELDMLILGGITSYGQVPVGAYQAAYFRVWMAGSSPLAFYGHPNVGGIFEAPLASLTAPSGMEMEGSIVAASITLGDQTNIHYDQAVQSSGLECGDPQVDPIP